MVDEYMKAATWIVCPLCDELKCVGRFNCSEIKAWIEEKKRREENEDRGFPYPGENVGEANT